MQELKGLNAAVTGGGDGIGAAIALQLARLGMNVAILDIRLSAAEEAAAACASQGVKSVAIACDVSVGEEVVAAAEHAVEALGPINLLWANAGVGIAQGITTAPREALRWLYGVNVDGLIDTMRAFVPAMREASGWRHVGISGSMAGLVQPPTGGPTAYVASKYAAVGIAEALSIELADDGIGVTVFCPGTVNTRIWDGGRAKPDRFGGPTYLPEQVGERWRRIGMNVDEAASVAVEALREGRFYAIMPESAERAARISQRTDAILAGVRMPHAAAS